MIFVEFFQSPAWRDIQTRVYATLGLSSVGTMAEAMPKELSIEQAEQLMKLEILTRWLAVGSYILSGIVALTVIARFVIWMVERYKQRKK